MALETAKKAAKSKTINFALLLALFGAAQANLHAVQEFVKPELYGWITFGVAIVVGVLRVVTTQPISEK